MKKPMKLLIAILQGTKNKKLHNQLLADGFRFTVMSSRGGFLGKTSEVMLIGIEESQIDSALAIFKSCCKTKKTTLGSSSDGLRMDTLGDFTAPAKTTTIEVGGATLFVIDVEKFIRF